MALDEGLAHALEYLGHTIFFMTMMIYAWAVSEDRLYFFSFLKGSAADKLKYGLLGLLFGAFLMGHAFLPPLCMAKVFRSYRL